MGKVAVPVLLMYLIVSACWAQSHASWYKPISLDFHKNPKAVGMQFYFHDNFSGSNITTVVIASGTNTSQSPTGFGQVGMGDSPLTVTRDPSSEVIGRAQGLHCSVAQGGRSTDSIVMFVLNIVFTTGEYNGSTLAILGRANTTELAEMPIVGGSGAFRLGRGYSTSVAVFIDSNNNAIVEYNVTVLYYS